MPRMQVGPAPSNVPGAPYPQINSDNSVTFRIRADGAQAVRVMNYDLKKKEDGFWTVTTKPLQPGF
jgi:hypothetical protein